MNGESGAIVGTCDDDPTCMHTTISRSLRGRHHRVPVAGRGRGWSGDRAAPGSPRSRTRSRPSPRSAPSPRPRAAGPTSGSATSGMYRPGALPHHSSIIQSLYAWRHTNPNSRSLASMNSCPQKRVMRREAQRRQHPGAVHVFEPRHGVVAPGPHLAVRQRLRAELLLRLPRDRAQPGARVALAVVHPVVEPVVELHVRGTVAILRRDAVDPDVRAVRARGRRPRSTSRGRRSSCPSSQLSDRHVLHLLERTDAVGPPLAAEAALLVATTRRVGAEHAGVHVDRAGAQTAARPRSRRRRRRRTPAPTSP